MWTGFSDDLSYGYHREGVLTTDSKDYKNIDGYPPIIEIRTYVTEAEYYSALDFARSSMISGNWKPSEYGKYGNSCVDYHRAVLSAGGLVKDPNFQGHLIPIHNEYYLRQFNLMNYLYEKNGSSMLTEHDLLTGLSVLEVFI